MEHIRFEVSTIQYGKKQYLSLVYNNDNDEKVYFIYKDKNILHCGGGWTCLNDGKRVHKNISIILDEAFLNITRNLQQCAN